MAARANKLIEQQQALDSFFESLMRDVEAYAEAELEIEETQAEVTPAPTPAVSERVSQPTPEVTPLRAPAPLSKPVQLRQAEPSIFETLPPLAPPAPVEVAPPIETPAPVKAEETSVPVESAPAAPSEPDVAEPAWMGKELQAMLFRVAGLTLAVPLVDLHGVVEWSEDTLTAMPGHADFYLGLMTHLKRNIPIVDTARLVLPPDKLRQLAGEDPRARITRVVLINDSRYGLACDEVNEVVTLKADEIRWRSERTQRRWLAGTVIKHMCALIDATAFAELLAKRAPVEAFRE